MDFETLWTQDFITSAALIGWSQKREYSGIMATGRRNTDNPTPEDHGKKPIPKVKFDLFKEDNQWMVQEILTAF